MNSISGTVVCRFTKKRKSISYLLFAFIFFLAAAPIFAGTVYYVNATNGSDAKNGLTPENAWKTINKINNSVFVPGDSILFKRGETWQETLTPPSHGASGNNITFGAYGTGALPKIDGSGRNYCVDGKKDYITITDLHFAFPNQYGIAHTKWNSSGLELSIPGWIVKNSTFTNCGVCLFGPDTVVQDNVFVGPSAITTTSGAVVIRGAVARNCSVLRNTISGYASRGVWFLNAPYSPTVDDNIIHDIGHTPGGTGGGFGIDFDGYGIPLTGTVTASRNTIYNCAALGINVENCSDASVISRNLIHDCPTGILYLNYAGSPRYPEQRGLDVDGVVAYNVIYHCRYAIRLNDVSHVDIWNNVLYDGLGSYPCSLTIDDAGSFVDNIDFRNNTIGSGMTKSISSKYAWENHFIAFDNNAVINPVFEERDTSTTLTLAQLQAGGAALNCFTTSPGFVDAAGHDFHLLPDSPCINAGIHVGLTQDYEGKSINGAPDIGAFESGPPMTTTPPTVTTTVPSAIQSTSATGGGNVTSDGGATVTARGVCWSTTVNPTTSNSKTVDGSGTGSFVSSITGLAPNTPYHVRAYATNSVGTAYGDDLPFTTIPAQIPVLSISKTNLYFGSIRNGSTTGTQEFMIENDGAGSLNWSITKNASWLSCFPTSGSGTEIVKVTVNSSGLALGTYKASITVAASGAANTPQAISVTLKVYRNGKTTAPFGSFDTPVSGSTVMGSIPVSGWALDDIEVTKVEVRRDPVAGDSPGAIEADGLVYIGDATFLEGARPDVEAAWPAIPMNCRAGWGYMMLTYGLPNKGNGTFILHAVAFDKDGYRAELGAKTIISDNANNNKPFGTIDTPTPGGVVSEDPYVSFCWVLTPPPAKIPVDGSTIWLWIDGIRVGHPTYNQFRADIHDAFPEYLNANGAVGFYHINTTYYANGMHSIALSATDDHGMEEGFGSRFFWIMNTGGTANSIRLNSLETSRFTPEVSPWASLKRIQDLDGAAEDVLSPVAIRTGFKDAGPYTLVTPDAKGIRNICIEEADRIDVSLEYSDILSSESEKGRRIVLSPRWSGYLVVGNELRPLPVGSTLDSHLGVFSWQPGPGFIGNYRIIFINRGDRGEGTCKSVSIGIRPRGSR